MSESGQPAPQGGAAKLVVSLVAVLLLAGAAVFTVLQWKSGPDKGTPAVVTPRNGNNVGTNPGGTANTAAADTVTTRGQDRSADRNAMVDHIRDFYHLDDPATLAAMRIVPREEYVPDDQVNNAYVDSPLPIPYGQLISQPWIVALMTLKLQLNKESRVLEIGTGSAYQASVLTYLTPHVYTIEIIKPLGEAAAARLKRLGYNGIQTKIDDGFFGWKEEAPFDAIIVTCAAGSIPPPLIEQLKPGGRMMIPVGQPFSTQSLMLVTKDNQDKIHSESLEPVRFVPLINKDPSQVKP